MPALCDELERLREALRALVAELDAEHRPGLRVLRHVLTAPRWT